MNKRDLKYFRKLIEQKREDLIEELTNLRETTVEESSRTSSGETSSYSYHMADLGTDSQEREKAYLFLARENQYLSYLNEALERIKAGAYGDCRTCGEQIPKERLEAVLHATQCVPCKNKSKEAAA